jgi:hypothetical protein
MTKQKVLLLGATGETGGDILNGLIEDGNLVSLVSISVSTEIQLTSSKDVSLLVRPSSANKPAVKAFASDGLNVVIADLSGDLDTLTKALIGYDILISAIDFNSQLQQIALVDAAAKAGIKRIIPCGFVTVCPPSGVMTRREEKEIVYSRILYHKIPYTIIDVGYWHQISFFSVPSGKFDYAQLIPGNQIIGTGDVKTLLTDKRDIGRFVARIIQDQRTLNRKVFTWSDEISHKEILKLIESKTGEKVDVKEVSIRRTTRHIASLCTNTNSQVSESELRATFAKAQALLAEDPNSIPGLITRSGCEYNISKFIRGDNTSENARYLGYLDARELYPDFKPISFSEFLDELIAGKAKALYSETMGPLVKKALSGNEAKK